VNPQVPPAATPAPLHDIVGPVAFFPYPLWMVAAAAALLLLLLLLGAWLIVRLRRRPARALTAAQRALAELARLRTGVETSDPYPFSIAVSDVLRTYLRDARGLRATTQTSREFLESVSRGQVFNDAEREALAAFLEKVDLIKFARIHATGGDSAALLGQAEQLVKSGETPATNEEAGK
jgi:hypothetical protein